MVSPSPRYGGPKQLSNAERLNDPCNVRLRAHVFWRTRKALGDPGDGPHALRPYGTGKRSTRFAMQGDSRLGSHAFWDRLL